MINDIFSSPILFILIGIIATLLTQWIFRLFIALKKRLFRDEFLQTLLRVPVVGPYLQAKIDKEVTAVLTDIQSDIATTRLTWRPVTTLPERGLRADEIVERFQLLQSHYHPARSSSTVYSDYDDELSKLLQWVWSKTALTNPLHPEWPLLNLMEAEVIAMCQHLLHGEKGASGMITHSGSMSILEACKAYVLHARKKGILTPEIIAPENVHVGFDKAAQILHAKLIKIPLDEKTGTVNLSLLKKAIHTQTCLLVASAPSFPFGLFDPIADIANIAKSYSIPLHIDACLGGFLTIFAEEAGFVLPPCDFSLPGVTSISLGTHKYGQTPNGTSLLLFSKSADARPTHVYLNWMGGMYVSPGIDGTRSGAAIATAWAVLCYKGKEEYVKETKKILTLARELTNQINDIEGLSLPYPPPLSIIGIKTAKKIDPLLVASHLNQQGGWQVTILQKKNKPIGFHFCLTAVHANEPNFAEIFIQDLRAAVHYAKTCPHDSPKGLLKAYKKLAKGVPHFVQEKMGKGYVDILNTVD